MYKLTLHRKRWRIEKGNEILLSGIGTANQALAIAKAHDYILSEFYNLQTLKRVA